MAKVYIDSLPAIKYSNLLRKINVLDLVNSFSPTSCGRKEEAFVTTEGKLIESYPALWQKGLKYYCRLCEIYECEPNNEDINIGFNEIPIVNRELRAIILRLLANNSIVINGTTGWRALKSFRINDPIGDFLNWLSVFDQIMPGTFTEGLRKEPNATHVLICLFFHSIDSILVAHEIRANISEAFSDILEIERLIVTTETSRAAISDSARKAGLARHNETNQYKTEALQIYTDNRTRYRSRAAAARELAKHFPVTVRTIEGWIKDHESDN